MTSAYCPHLGANVAVGGRVVPGEDCVECPFHEWRFRGDTGRCQGVPYSEGKVRGTEYQDAKYSGTT